MEVARRAEQITAKLGPAIRARRVALGLSMNVLSTKSGLTVSSIGYVETGQRRPSVDTLCRLALAFGCLPSELLQEAESQ
jgi:transcriptional regulator with XRE-family HTH domain